jgi:hypothetical protein
MQNTKDKVNKNAIRLTHAQLCEALRPWDWKKRMEIDAKRFAEALERQGRRSIWHTKCEPLASMSSERWKRK